MRSSLLAVFGLAVCVALAWGQGFQVKVNVELVDVDVYVDDTSGKPITDLTRDDFTILEDGSPQEISSFASAETPYNILLLFDRSSSTEDQWPFLVRSIARFMDQLPEQHRVALAAFDEKPEMLMEWKSPRAFRQAYAIPSTNGGTRLYEAIEWAIANLRNIKGRRGIVIFTDGVDNRLSKDLVSFDRSGMPRIAPPQDDAAFQRMLRILRESRLPVYFVAVHTGDSVNSFELQQRAAASERMELVAHSNGRLHLPRNIREVEQLYAQIGRELGNSYSLGFAPTKHDGLPHRIEVRVRGNGLRVTASREQYTAQ